MMLLKASQVFKGTELCATSPKEQGSSLVIKEKIKKILWAGFSQGVFLAGGGIYHRKQTKGTPHQRSHLGEAQEEPWERKETLQACSNPKSKWSPEKCAPEGWIWSFWVGKGCDVFVRFSGKAWKKKKSLRLCLFMLISGLRTHGKPTLLQSLDTCPGARFIGIYAPPTCILQGLPPFP